MQEQHFPDDKHGPGLLRQACRLERNKGLEFIEELYKFGLDYSSVGLSTLMVAARCGNVDVMKLLLSNGASLDAVDKQGRNVVHHACIGGHEATLAALRNTAVDWNRKAEVTIDSKQVTGATALHIAASLNSSILDYLLKEILISDIDSITDDSETALFIATWQKNPRNVVSLLSAESKCPCSLASRKAKPLVSLLRVWETMRLRSNSCDTRAMSSFQMTLD